MVLIFIFLLAGAGLAQIQPALMENVGAANLPEQEIGVNDLVAVSVYRSPELTRTVRVATDGAIALPLLKRRIPSEGLRPAEMEDAIARALKEEGLLVDPIVEVTVAEYASRPISVVGAVTKPITFQAVGRTTLLDAIAQAGGLSTEAAQEILVSVPHTGLSTARPMVRRIAVKEIINDARPELNLVLRGGEEIRVPQAGRVYVVGNVEKPGSYPVPDPTDASVLRMIALAEGLIPYHRKKAYIYRKDADTGYKYEIEVELAQILKREAPDIPIQLNDVLYIPDNPGKRTRNKVIDRSFTFATAVVSGIFIWAR